MAEIEKKDGSTDGKMQVSLKTQEKLTEFMKASQLLENIARVDAQPVGLTPEKEEIPKKRSSDRGGGPTSVYLTHFTKFQML